MNIVLLTLLIFVILVIKPSEQASKASLKVSVYYDAVCPKSTDFIQSQLYPAYKKLGSSLVLDLIPYGKVERKREKGKWVFKCQHGPGECAVNKFTACGLAKNNNQDAQMEFVYCIESHVEDDRNNVKKLANNCASLLKVSADKLLKCAKGSEGDQLLAKLGEKQDKLNPKLRDVPWLTFNGIYNAALQIHATRNFLEDACTFLTSKTAGCK